MNHINIKGPQMDRLSAVIFHTELNMLLIVTLQQHSFVCVRASDSYYSVHTHQRSSAHKYQWSIAHTTQGNILCSV